MIRKQDILDRATEWQLRPEVVEKDYVLGWLLAALASYPDAHSVWIFKGGTCIKKCYVETYRFSEDLDFSFLPEAPYTQEAIHENLRTLTRIAHDLSGIDFPEELIQVKPRQNKQRQSTFQGRISYRGPLGYAGPTPSRILFDITQHEAVLDEPSLQSVFHPYPDALPEGIGVFTYSFNELMAEKTRALFERSRPRDLYDVIYLLENRADVFDLPHVQDLFRRKCQVKNLIPPSAAELLGTVQAAEEMRSEWENMLGHQLSVLPLLDDLLARLPDLLRWIDEPLAAIAGTALPAVPVSARETPIMRPGIQYWGGGLPLEVLRFAGANRLLVEFDYNGKHRLVEPYSLRQADTGNLLFYAWERGETHIKAFNVAKMYNVRSTSTSFQPRYRIELTSGGPLSMPSVAAPIRTVFSSPSRSRSKYGPTYIFECPYCQKRFRHSKNNPQLKKHKSKDGWDCPGRRGYLIDTQWS